MTFVNKVWNGSTFVATDSDTVDRRNVDDGAPSTNTLWTSQKISNELEKKASKDLATSSSSGLMSASDKANLDALVASSAGAASFSRSLTLTAEWQDYGIGGAELETGSYLLQIQATDQAVTGQFQEIYTGTMSWYSGATTSDESDEIILHKAGKSPSDAHIYLRTKRNASGILRLQIAYTRTLTSATDITIKLKKMF